MTPLVAGLGAQFNRPMAKSHHGIGYDGPAEDDSVAQRIEGGTVSIG